MNGRSIYKILIFIYKLKNLFNRLKMILWYNFFLIKNGKNNLIIKPILLTPGCLYLHSNIFIRNNARIEGVFNFLNQTFKPIIEIKTNVNIEQNVHLTCGSSIIIGKNTSIASNVTITDIIHTSHNILKPIKEQQLECKEVEIGENCVIYNNSVILPGTKIGANSIVGANSLVKGIFPPYSIIAGSPAKIIKNRNNN